MSQQWSVQVMSHIVSAGVTDISSYHITSSHRMTYCVKVTQGVFLEQTETQTRAGQPIKLHHSACAQAVAVVNHRHNSS